MNHYRLVIWLNQIGNDEISCYVCSARTVRTYDYQRSGIHGAAPFPEKWPLGVKFELTRAQLEHLNNETHLSHLCHRSYRRIIWTTDMLYTGLSSEDQSLTSR